MFLSLSLALSVLLKNVEFILYFVKFMMAFSSTVLLSGINAQICRRYYKFIDKSINNLGNDLIMFVFALI